jgi:hypothetical protein
MTCTAELLTYLLTTWNRYLLEKLTGLQLVKKFPAFFGPRMFITARKSGSHLSLSWDSSSIQSILPHPTSWRSILILSSHLYLGIPSGLIPSGFPHETLSTHLPSPYALHAPPISSFSIFLPEQYWVRSTSPYTPQCFSLHFRVTSHIKTVRYRTIQFSMKTEPDGQCSLAHSNTTVYLCN